MAPSTVASPALPLSINSPTDVGRLIREAEAIDSYMLQFELKGMSAQAVLPKTTVLLNDLIAANQLNLLLPQQRTALIGFLKTIRDKAPVLHISFGADPSTEFVQKLALWLRREVHPDVLITVGLQPNIGAGCLVRSTNKYFDFSLRKNFAENRDLLMSKLRETVTV